MKKHHPLLAAAVISASGFCFLSSPARAESPSEVSSPAVQQSTEKYTPGSLPAGIEKKNLDEAKDIRQAMGGVLKTALTAKDYDSLVGYFVDADRNRLDKWGDQKMNQQLADSLNQFRQAWKQKYNQDFDVKSELVFGDQFQGLAIAQGEISNPAMLSNWPVASPGSAPQDQRLDKTDRPGNRPGDRNLEKGRNVAVVHIPAGHNLPETNVSLINEAFGWRFDLPDNITGQQLEQNLTTHIQQFVQSKDQWPADVNEAYRLAAHHIFAALYNVQASDVQGNIQR